MERCCVFCGGRPLTLEHVFPQWIASSPPEQERWSGQDTALFYGPGIDRAESAPASRQMGKTFTSTTVRRVCATCNHGWMEELESKVRPVLTRLMRGEAFTIGAEDVRMLATWVAKTSMMAEFTHPESCATSPAEHRAFFESRQPPANMQIWMAPTETVDWDVRYEHSGLLFGDPTTDPDLPCNVHESTLGLGKVVFCVLGGCPSVLPFPQIDEFWPFASVRIWPEPRTVQWNRNLVLDDEAVWLMSDLLRLTVRPDDEILTQMAFLEMRSMFARKSRSLGWPT